MANVDLVKRYCVRDSHKREKDTKLNSNEVILSENLPKPNVVRIEVLPAYVRQYYLGGYYGTGDKLKSALMESMQNASSFLPFYGILDKGSLGGQGFEVTSSWVSTPKRGFSHMLQMADTALGAIPGIGKPISSVINGAGKFVETTQKLMNTFGGIDNVSTGASTIKTLQNVSFKPTTSINVKWYMPEQSRLCRIGIERLMNIAYVHGLGPDNANRQAEFLNNVLDNGLNVVKKGTDTVSEYMTENDFKQIGWASGKLSEGVEKIRDSVVTTDNIEKVLNTVDEVNSWFGNNMTVNPLPVRVSIGHIMDMEPMVITNVSITCSAEQFITDDGTHIPIWVQAAITVDQWMNPGPDKQFFSFIGDEIFNGGTNAGERTSDTSTSASKKSGNKKSGKKTSSASKSGGSKTKGTNPKADKING